MRKKPKTLYAPKLWIRVSGLGFGCRCLGVGVSKLEVGLTSWSLGDFRVEISADSS